MSRTQIDPSLLVPVTVPKGGTGLSSDTAYAVFCGGTTSTGAHQQVSGLGTSGQVLTSNGAGSLPTWQTPFIVAQVTLTDAATIAVNAALGSTFTVTLGGNRTLGAPTNPTAWQKIVFVVRQPVSGGPYTLSYTSGTGGYRFGSTFSSITLSTSANAVDYIGAIYNATDSIWDMVSLSQGF